MVKEIKITCSYNETLSFNDLLDFQGALKHRTDEDIKKIVNSINKHGFSFPFFVWVNEGKNYVLDGHGRLSALKYMQNEGITIPDLPVVYVKCKDEKAAKDLLLRLNSQYGRMTKKSVLDFIGQDFELNLDDFQLPALNIDLSSPFEPVDDYYKKQIEQRDYVSPTTSATNPVVNESRLEDEPIRFQYEIIESRNNSEPVLPESFENNDIKQKDFIAKITFKTNEQINTFLSEYQQELKEKYDCIISVSGGML